MADADNDTQIQVEASTDQDKIRLSAGGTETMVIDNGKVGIGTASPASLLELAGSGASRVRFGDGGTFPHLFSSNRDIVYNADVGNAAAAAAFSFRRTSYTAPVTFADLFVISGNGDATLTGTLTQSSDRIFKKEIEDLPYGLKEVMQMQPRSYRYKASNQKSIGFVAQELKELVPELVKGEDGNLSVAYSLVTSVLTNAIKELNVQNVNLEAQLGGLRAENVELTERVRELEGLEKRLARLESMIYTTNR